MDRSRFDSLVRALDERQTRRSALHGTVGLAYGLIGLRLFARVSDAHDNWSRCKNIPSKDKRKRCQQKGAEHKLWHKSNACRGQNQKCDNRPCCDGLNCENGRCTKAGDVLGTTPGNPGGLWVTPTNGFRVTGDVLSFEARAYPEKAGDAPVSYVNFTAKPEGKPWMILCTAYAPSPGTDRYACTANLRNLGVPAGPITVSFDVYDAAFDGSKGYNKAPHGLREGTIDYARSGGLLAPVPSGATVTVIHGYNDPLPTENCPPPANHSADHCRHQMYGLDFFSNLTTLVAPGSGVVAWGGIETGGDCMGLTLDEGNVNLTICHHDSVTVSNRARVSRGQCLGSWSGHIHLSLDNRLSEGLTGTGIRNATPLPFTGKYSIEGRDFDKGPDTTRNQHDDKTFASTNACSCCR